MICRVDLDLELLVVNNGVPLHAGVEGLPRDGLRGPGRHPVGAVPVLDVRLQARLGGIAIAALPGKRNESSIII